MQSLFGTRTSADINLAAQLILLAGLWIGFALARKKRFGHHANVQTTMVLLNLLFILFVMVSSFYSYVIQGGTGDSVARWMIVHAVLGTVAEVTGIYLILRMRTGVIPKRWQIKNFKLMMRSTLALWTVLVVLGVIVYEQRYLTVEASFSVGEKKGGAAAAPVFQLAQAGSDLNMHAMEMSDAAVRGNLPTVKRHAEHLVNLIEGGKGVHYGDLDTNGHLEDPGDGTGALVYVRRIADASHDAKTAEQAAALTAELTVIRDNALSVTSAADLASVNDLVTESASVARRANAEGISTINGSAQAAGVLALPYTEPPAAGTTTATVTILEENFGYAPFEVTVDVGTTVVWINKERAKHTVTADDGSFDSGDQEMENVFQHTFDTPGTYPYYCRYHGDKGVVGMAGTIIVQ